MHTVTMQTTHPWQPLQYANAVSAVSQVSMAGSSLAAQYQIMWFSSVRSMVCTLRFPMSLLNMA